MSHGLLITGGYNSLRFSLSGYQTRRWRNYIVMRFMSIMVKGH